MHLENYFKLKECVSHSDLILIGLGEEWVLSEEEILSDLIQKNRPVYELFCKVFQSEEYAELYSVFIAYYLNNYIPKIYQRAYEKLYELIKDKNYFVVSLTLDSYLQQFGFKSDRVVNPCGTYDLLQCSYGCTNELVSSAEMLEAIKNVLIEIDEEKNDPNSQWDVLGTLNRIRDIVFRYQCKNCGHNMVFNTLESGKYREEGYLDKWQLYMKWLQGTVNKKLCVIEAGVGMQLPSVIRWPFEKTVFYNQKASMFRIHEKFYQVNETVAERSYGCKCNAVQLFCEESVEASI